MVERETLLVCEPGDLLRGEQRLRVRLRCFEFPGVARALPRLRDLRHLVKNPRRLAREPQLLPRQRDSRHSASFTSRASTEPALHQFLRDYLDNRRSAAATRCGRSTSASMGNLRDELELLRTEREQDRERRIRNLPRLDHFAASESEIGQCGLKVRIIPKRDRDGLVLRKRAAARNTQRATKVRPALP